MEFLRRNVFLVLRRKLVRLAAVVCYWGDIGLQADFDLIEQPWGFVDRASLCSIRSRNSKLIVAATVPQQRIQLVSQKL